MAAPDHVPERMHILPHPALRASIAHYTVFFPARNKTPAQTTLKLIPDASGCVVVIIGREVETLYWGPTSEVVEVDNNPAERPFMIFVEFNPGGAHRLWRMPMRQFENAVVSLQQIDSALARRIAADCDRRFGGTVSDWSGLVADLDQAFLSMLAGPDRLALPDYIVSSVIGSGGEVKIYQLADATGYTSRHLNRIARDAFGTSVKRLSRIVRINRACQALKRGDANMTMIAQRCGYHDQAHFIQDFTAICGAGPGEYLRSMSVFYNEQIKLNAIIPEPA
ncbi:MAG: helix-turn-helix transcriptional regulator [Planctomycetes bacterium]|nr:helix-turn-helix transcriptional regulator [Planctomycetota bacterium]